MEALNPKSVPPPNPTLVNPPPVQSKSDHTLYNSGLGSIFFRNLLAGFARALGGVILYAVFLGVMGQLFITHIWPRFEPIFSTFETFNQMSAPSTTSPPSGIQIDPATLNSLLNTLKQP